MTEKTAPVQAERGARIPWDIHVRAWQVYAALGHGSQSAQRIAERGGFGCMELAYLLTDRNPWLGGAPLTPAQQVRLIDLRTRNAESEER